MTQIDVQQAISHVRELPALNHVCDYDCESHCQDGYYFLNETETRYFIIDPVLRALGWSLSDSEQIAFEVWLNNHGRVDYVMYDEEWDPCIILEAKALGNWAESHEKQLQQYVRRIRSGYAVLTNGRKWKVWDLNQRNEAKYLRFEKLLVLDLDITEQSPRARDGTTPPHSFAPF